MSKSQGPPPSPVSVEEIGRRLRWPALPALLFVALLVGLAVAALNGLRREPPVVSGLPDDPDARAAADLVRGRFAIRTVDLRFESALFGAPPAGAGDSVLDAHSPGARPALDRAEVLLGRAAERRRDPRLVASLAAIELARDSLRSAERRYRGVLDRTSSYGEAHLGLGVTLAAQAARLDDERERRGLLLEAIAQFAAVRAEDPSYAPALYDRAWLLVQVGRTDEARRRAMEYRERDPKSAWSARLDALVGAPR